MADIANVVEGAPEKLAESMQFFMQGCGVLGGAPCLMCPAHHTSLELLWSNLINPTFKLKVLYYKIRSVAFTAFTLSV